jgi:MFS family permease
VPDPTSLFDPRLRGTTIAILLVVGLSAFEGLAVAAALPQIAASLGGLELLPWVITSYLLTSGVATLAAGVGVDQWGPRRIYRGSLLLFIGGSLLAGVAPTMELLVAARAVQGVGAGGLGAVALTAVGLVYPRKLVAHAFAANANVWGVMSVGGPAIASVMLLVASWRWLFLLNLPLGGVAVLLGWSAFPARAATDGPARSVPLFDLGLLTAFTLALLRAVDALSLESLAWGALALVSGAALLHRGRTRDDALLKPRHALLPPLGPLHHGVALLLVGAIGLQSFVPLLMRAGRGAGAAEAAWSLLFFTVGWTSGANIGSRWADRVGPHAVLHRGATLVPLAVGSLAATAFLRLPGPVVFAVLFATGLGIGMATNSALSLLRDLADDAELGRATAAHQYLRTVGMALGNAFVGAVLLLVVGQLTGDVEQLRQALDAASTAPAPAVRDAIQTGYAWAAAAGTGVTLIACLLLRSTRPMGHATTEAVAR